MPIVPCCLGGYLKQKFNLKRSVSIWAPIVFLVAGSVAQAMPVIVPAGLNALDNYRLAFTTSTTRDGTSADIADYNAYVDNLGDNAVASNWTAIASTPTTDARNNTSTQSGTEGVDFRGIFNLAGELLALTYDSLWDINDDLDHRLNYDETGTAIVGSAGVWTGTKANGSGEIDEELGNLGGDQPVHGDVALLTSGDVNANPSSITGWLTGNTAQATTNLRLYGISDILTIPVPPPKPNPVPEPGSLVLAAIGATLLVGGGRCRRKTKAKRLS